MKTLIVIDMQKDFVTGTLGTKEAAAIVDNVKKKIDTYKAEGNQIIFTRDTHWNDYLNTNEGKHLPVRHCIKDSDGWQVLPELDIADAVHVDKPNFGYPLWKERFRFEAVELVGVCTDICVVSNALILKAQFPEIDITVDASCCAGVTVDSHHAALTTMKMCQVHVIGA